MVTTSQISTGFSTSKKVAANPHSKKAFNYAKDNPEHAKKAVKVVKDNPEASKKAYNLAKDNPDVTKKAYNTAKENPETSKKIYNASKDNSKYVTTGEKGSEKPGSSQLANYSSSFNRGKSSIPSTSSSKSSKSIDEYKSKVSQSTSPLSKSPSSSFHKKSAMSASLKGSVDKSKSLNYGRPSGHRPTSFETNTSDNHPLHARKLQNYPPNVPQALNWNDFELKQVISKNDFNGGQSGDLQFSSGDNICILSAKNDKEWAIGRNLRTNRIGLFPLNFCY